MTENDMDKKLEDEMEAWYLGLYREDYQDIVVLDFLHKYVANDVGKYLGRCMIRTAPTRRIPKRHPPRWE